MELSEPESALPLTKSLQESQGILDNANTCRSSLPTACPRVPGGTSLRKSPKVKAARIQGDEKDPSVARSECLQALVWKNLCAEFTGRRLKGRERKWLNTKSSGLPAGLPLDLHTCWVPSSETESKGKEGEPAVLHKGSWGKVLQPKANLIHYTPGGWAKDAPDFWGKFQPHLSVPTTTALQAQTSWGNKSAPSLEAWGLFPLSLTLQV